MKIQKSFNSFWYPQNSSLHKRVELQLSSVNEGIFIVETSCSIKWKILRSNHWDFCQILATMAEENLLWIFLEAFCYIFLVFRLLKGLHFIHASNFSSPSWCLKYKVSSSSYSNGWTELLIPCKIYQFSTSSKFSLVITYLPRKYSSITSHQKVPAATLQFQSDHSLRGVEVLQHVNNYWLTKCRQRVSSISCYPQLYSLKCLICQYNFISCIVGWSSSIHLAKDWLKIK